MKVEKCKNCGKEFNKRHKNHLFCSQECKFQYHYYVEPNYKTLTCDNCGKEFQTKQTRFGKNNFCCHKCSVEFWSKEHSITKQCEICGKDFTVRKSLDRQRFCSIQCQSKWQSIYRVGENSATYDHSVSKEERTVTCRHCGKKFIPNTKYYSVRRAYCSAECKQLNTGSTNPEIAIEKILLKNNIKFEKEYSFQRYRFDFYLLDYDLIIEVMGSYWHIDSRKYAGNFLSERQKRVIRKDRGKMLKTKSILGINILYIWEDSAYDEALSTALILEYIKNKGVLENYNSFNYEVEKNNIKLKKETIKTFCELTI